MLTNLFFILYLRELSVNNIDILHLFHLVILSRNISSTRNIICKLSFSIPQKLFKIIKRDARLVIHLWGLPMYPRLGHPRGAHWFGDFTKNVFQVSNLRITQKTRFFHGYLVQTFVALSDNRIYWLFDNFQEKLALTQARTTWLITENFAKK